MIYEKCKSRAGLAALLLFTTVASLSAVPICADEPQLLPRQIFFGNPDRAGVKISPDGKWLSYLAPSNGVMNVWVQSVPPTAASSSTPRAGSPAKPSAGAANDAKAVTNSTKRPIRNYFWAQNSQQIIYSQDREGDENHHLYAVEIDNGKEIDLTPFDGAQARLTASDRRFPDEILVSINNRNPQLHDVWRINTRTGKGEMIFQNDAGYAQVVADSQFVVRAASKVNSRTGGLDAYVRASATAPWEELASWGLDDSDTSGPIGFDREGKVLYVMDSRGADTGGLFAFKPQADGAVGYELLARNPKADLAGIVIDPITERPQAVAFEYAGKEWKILDRSIQGDWDYLSRVAEGDFSIGARDNADKKWIVTYLRDDGPVSYYLYDRKAKQATFLFSNRAQLENLQLAKMKPVLIPSRDGLTLVSYLTLPTGAEQTNLPMVLLVHGGPWARDRWGYNAIHQWLANRGYAVLSVNFRGSTGFGKKFLNAGNREWSGKMHNDLIDAVNWAVQQKIANPDRVAIMGGSYGGYATLVGLTFTPDFFAAGVDIVGPSHIRTLLETIPPYWKPILAKFETRVGSLSEPEFLDQISPLKRVDEIRKPLLIGQGKNDPRVKESESQQIVKAMQDKGLPVTYVVFPDEGHGFARPQNNMAFFAITEAFLAQHLGGRFEPIGSAVRESSAQVQAGAELVPDMTGEGAPPSPAPPLAPATPAAVDIDSVNPK